MAKKTSTPRTLRSALRRVRDLIEAGWTQEAYARDCYGHRVSTDSPSACKFCLSGAIDRAVSDNGTLYSHCLDALRRQLPLHGDGIINFNDRLPRGPKGKAQVLDLIDRAIKAA